MEDLVAWDVEKAEVHNHFCAFVILLKEFSVPMKDETINFIEIYTHAYDVRLCFNLI